MKPCHLAEEDLLVVDAFGASGVGLWRCRMSEEPLPARKKLSLELLGGAVGDISGCVARFNAQSAEYYIEATDLTAAFPVIDDRLLDLYALIDAEFSREDFVALRAFESGGALYSVAPCFDVSTYVGLEHLVGGAPAGHLRIIPPSRRPSRRGRSFLKSCPRKYSCKTP